MASFASRPKRLAGGSRSASTLERIRVSLNGRLHFQAGSRSVFRAMHSSAPSSIRFTMALRANALRRALSRTMSPAIAGDLSRSSRPCHCEAEDNNESQHFRHLSSNSRCRGALCLRCQMRAALSAAAQRSVHALPAQDSSNCLGRCGLPSSARRARMRPNPSLNRTPTGMRPWPRSGAVHLPLRGQSRMPLRAG